MAMTSAVFGGAQLQAVYTYPKFNGQEYEPCAPASKQGNCSAHMLAQQQAVKDLDVMRREAPWQTSALHLAARRLRGRAAGIRIRVGDAAAGTGRVDVSCGGHHADAVTDIPVATSISASRHVPVRCR